MDPRFRITVNQLTKEVWVRFLTVLQSCSSFLTCGMNIIQNFCVCTVYNDVWIATI